MDLTAQKNITETQTNSASEQKVQNIAAKPFTESPTNNQKDYNKQVSTQDKKQKNIIVLSPGFKIAFVTLIISLFFTFLLFEYIQTNINDINQMSLLLLIGGITFGFILFIVLYLMSNSRSKAGEKISEYENRLIEQEKNIQLLYEILQPQENNNYLGKILDFGTNALSFDLGIISRTDGSDYTILNYYLKDQDFNKEQIYNIGKACYGISFYANSTVAIENMDTSIFKDHSCHKQFGQKTYIGAPLWVDNNRFGTLNFFSTSQRVKSFTKSEINLVNLLSRLISISIERKIWNEKLKANNEELEWLNKIKIGRELRMIELKKQINELKAELQKTKL